jgi:hypothetical protein
VLTLSSENASHDFIALLVRNIVVVFLFQFLFSYISDVYTSFEDMMFGVNRLSTASAISSSLSSSSSSSLTVKNEIFIKHIELLRDQVDIRDSYIDCCGFFPIRRSNIAAAYGFVVYHLFVTLQMHKIQES